MVRRRLRVREAYDPGFWRTSGAYDVLGAAIRDEVAGWRDWPDVARYDGWASALHREARRPLGFRDVPRASVVARGGYDRFIDETDQIPTRSRSWHDFFNACIWTRLPRAKLAVHAAQRAEGAARTSPGRSRRQDWLTHFDECGVVLVSARRELLDRVAALDWQRTFVDEREPFVNDVRVFCFGHAILEALREPYVGLMGKALLCHLPDQGLAQPDAPDTALAHLDRWLAARLAAPELPPLHALPVLGVPGWHAPNERRSFYDQPRYFRTRPLEQTPAAASP
ncbi:MAG TPA: DUF3025 domain-containing protein [Polyangiaceae bacterium]|nr:DUF3025 domain-containing protein [Polyangiaceae bacterium]